MSFLHARPIGPADAADSTLAAIFWSADFRAIFDDLLHALDHGAGGITLITGPSGVGKTTLLRIFAPHARSAGHLVALPSPHQCRQEGVLPPLLRALGCAEADGPEALHGIEQAAMQARARGAHVIIALDDAHMLPQAALTDLSALCRQEGCERVSIIMAGQIGLAARLQGQADLHVRATHLLQAIGRREFTEFVSDRLEAANAPGDLFTASAIDALWRASLGLPRLACRYLDAILETHDLETQQKVLASVVTAAVADVGSFGVFPQRRDTGFRDRGRPDDARDTVAFGRGNRADLPRAPQLSEPAPPPSPAIEAAKAPLTSGFPQSLPTARAADPISAPEPGRQSDIADQDIADHDNAPLLPRGASRATAPHSELAEPVPPRSRGGDPPASSSFTEPSGSTAAPAQSDAAAEPETCALEAARDLAAPHRSRATANESVEQSANPVAPLAVGNLDAAAEPAADGRAAISRRGRAPGLRDGGRPGAAAPLPSAEPASPTAGAYVPPAAALDAASGSDAPVAEKSARDHPRGATRADAEPIPRQAEARPVAPDPNPDRQPARHCRAGSVLYHRRADAPVKISPAAAPGVPEALPSRADATDPPVTKPALQQRAAVANRRRASAEMEGRTNPVARATELEPERRFIARPGVDAPNRRPRPAPAGRAPASLPAAGDSDLAPRSDATLSAQASPSATVPTSPPVARDSAPPAETSDRKPLGFADLIVYEDLDGRSAEQRRMGVPATERGRISAASAAQGEDLQHPGPVPQQVRRPATPPEAKRGLVAIFGADNVVQQCLLLSLLLPVLSGVAYVLMGQLGFIPAPHPSSTLAVVENDRESEVVLERALIDRQSLAPNYAPPPPPRPSSAK